MSGFKRSARYKSLVDEFYLMGKALAYNAHGNEWAMRYVNRYRRLYSDAELIQVCRTVNRKLRKKIFVV